MKKMSLLGLLCFCMACPDAPPPPPPPPPPQPQTLSGKWEGFGNRQENNAKLTFEFDEATGLFDAQCEYSDKHVKVGGRYESSDDQLKLVFDSSKHDGHVDFGSTHPIMFLERCVEHAGGWVTEHSTEVVIPIKIQDDKNVDLFSRSDVVGKIEKI